MDEPTLSLVLFSGTDDKLNAAGVLAVGAAAMGRPVKVFLQYWALRAFRADAIHKDHGLAPEADEDGALQVRAHPGDHWSDLFRQAKEIGDVDIQACSLSMQMFGYEISDLDPLVQGQQGVAAFFAAADGTVTFI